MDECGISGVLHTEDTLFGIVENGGTIQGKLDAEGVLIGEVGFPKCQYPEAYEGDYEVTPKLHITQTLDTDGKYMEDDVIVLEVPYYETSNESGGTTVYICTEGY